MYFFCIQWSSTWSLPQRFRWRHFYSVKIKGQGAVCLMHLGQPSACHGGESTIQCFNLQPKRQGFPGPSAPASRPAVDQRPRVVYFAERPNDLHQSHFFGSIMLIFVVFVWAIVTWWDFGQDHGVWPGVGRGGGKNEGLFGSLWWRDCMPIMHVL